MYIKPSQLTVVYINYTIRKLGGGEYRFSGPTTHLLNQELK